MSTFTGDVSGTNTITTTPGAWDPDMEQLWREWIDQFGDYQTKTQEDADYKAGVQGDYRGDVSAAMEKYLSPAFSLTVNGNTVGLVPNANLAALETATAGYGDIRDSALQTTPNAGYFDYMDALQPIAEKGMDYRYENPTVTGTADLDVETPTVTDIANWLDLGKSAADILGMFKGTSAYESVKNMLSGLGSSTSGTAGAANAGTAASTMGDAASLAQTLGGSGLAAMGAANTAATGGLVGGADIAGLAAAEAGMSGTAGAAGAGTALSGAASAIPWVGAALAVYNILSMRDSNGEPNWSRYSLLKAAEGEESDPISGDAFEFTSDGQLLDLNYDKGNVETYDLNDEKFLESLKYGLASEAGLSLTGREIKNMSADDILNAAGYNSYDDMISGAQSRSKARAETWQGLH